MPKYHLQVFRPSSSFWGFSTLTWEELPCSGFDALITKNEARLWTDGRYFMQETYQLSDQWQLMRMEEDPAVDIWMAAIH
ncbi:putative Xaa-Pro aminopeptidase P [Prunus yedoensis var. nudiflora]|uniref:Putative Xaa-Pro aminopeptidase P n=1 Tax=Prunus yedoensis var. nudiflora TaxID=2094558 RepID=A0A314UFE2_PRUYE|nr:putative Xaa-Pro aminopeptidase P [Prunus yedoensis var. nudiflora]